MPTPLLFCHNSHTEVTYWETKSNDAVQLIFACSSAFGGDKVDTSASWPIVIFQKQSTYNGLVNIVQSIVFTSVLQVGKQI